MSLWASFSFQMSGIQQLHSDLLSELAKEQKDHNRIEQILLDVLKADMKAFESAILQVNFLFLFNHTFSNFRYSPSTKCRRPTTTISS